MEHIFLLSIIAILWGQMEQHIYFSGYSDTSKHLFGKLSINYHLPLIAMWILICFGFNNFWFFPLFMVIEDISYFVKNNKQILNPTSWINFGLGGFYIFNQWVPFVYIIGLCSSLVLFMLQ